MCLVGGRSNPSLRFRVQQSCPLLGQPRPTQTHANPMEKQENVKKKPFSLWLRIPQVWRFCCPQSEVLWHTHTHIYPSSFSFLPHARKIFLLFRKHFSVNTIFCTLKPLVQKNCEEKRAKTASFFHHPLSVYVFMAFSRHARWLFILLLQLTEDEEKKKSFREDRLLWLGNTMTAGEKRGKLKA